MARPETLKAVQKLAKTLNKKGHSLAEICEKADLTPHTARNLIRLGEEQGLITRKGITSQTKYLRA